MSRVAAFFTLLAVALAAADGQAQDVPRGPLASPTATSAAADPPPPPPAREGTAEFAFVGTTGNSSTQTIGLSGTYIVRPESWVITNSAAFVRNESEGETTANAFQYAFRAERKITPRLSGFADYTYFRDEFAGVSHRNALVGGLSYKIVDTARQLFFVDGGLGYLNEQRLVPPDVSTGVYAFGSGYRLKLSETATFTDDLRFTGTFAEADDWRLSHVAAITARLTTLLSLKVSNSLRYAHRPVEGFDTTDTVTAIALVAKF
jgi:putative salt-induced outer membrane protein